MKLLLVLSIVAYGYADKLDRAYLPPVTAASAGGSPGSLTAPGFSSQSSFGQGLPSPSGRQPISVIGEVGQVAFGQGLPSSSESQQVSSSGQYRPPSYSGASAQNTPGSNQNIVIGANSATSAPQGQSSGFFPQPSTFNVIGQQSLRPQSGISFNQAFEQGTQQGQGINVAQAYKPDRAQAAGDRSAEILKYVNENNGDNYIYSYETSNGIAAEESGDATNGVKAQGGFSYTDDDGQAYSLTYTADENGFQPQGEHLPTPHPIPEEILKSIEENAKAAAAGTQEGAYRPEEDIDDSSQRYNTGLSSLTQSQGNKGFNQGSFPGQGVGTIQPQNSQYSINQGALGSNVVGDQSGQSGQGRPNHGSNQFVSKPTGSQDQIGQYQQSSGTTSQIPYREFTGQTNKPGQIFQKQGQSSSGYTYSQPQKTYGSATQFSTSTSAPNRPQINGQGQFGTPTGSFGLESTNRPSSVTPFGNLNRPENQPSGSVSIFAQGQKNLVNANKPLFEPARDLQIQSGNQGFLGSGSSGQVYQYQPSTSKPSIGGSNQISQYKPTSNQQAIGASNGISQGNSLFVDDAGTNEISRGSQYQQNVNQPSLAGNIGTQGPNNQGSSKFASGIKGTGTGQTNKPVFGSNVGPSQSTSQFGLGGQDSSKDVNSIQAPYQYNRPSPTFSSQQRPGSSDVNTQVPGASSFGSPNINGQRPGFGSPGAQNINVQRPGTSFLESQNINGQRPGSLDAKNINGQQPDFGVAGSQSYDGQRPGVSSSNSQNINGQRPGDIPRDSQSINGQRPGTVSPGSQSYNGQRPSYNSPSSQDINVQRPDISVDPQSYNGQRPGTSSPGTQGGNGERLGLSTPGSTSFNGQRLGLSTTGYQGINEQRPDGSSPGSAGRPSQGRPEQFVGPRQPPSFSAQEGYKY